MRTVQQFPDKLQKRRAQRGKLPLLSFNTVRLNLPKEDITSRGTHVQRGSGVRWHRIIGYWRISRHGDPEAYFIWVPPGERGDKRLGIVLKERHARVRGGGRTSPEALHAA